MKEDLSKKINYWTGVIVLGCMLGFSVQIVNGWVGPTVAPPGGNVSGPVNVGSFNQYKTGGLGIGMTALPTEKLEVGGNLKMQNPTGRGQIIFNSADPGTFGSTTSGYNTINTNSRKGYIGIYGGPNWTDGGAVEVGGADFNGTESDRGAVAISFVGGTDGHHNGFYVVDSTDLNDLPLAIKKVSNSTTTPWRADMRRIDLVVQRSIYASHFYYTSDERLKNNVSEIGNALDKIDQLKGVSFSWKDGGKKSMGFLAQEVEKVFPELVSLEKEEDPNSYKSVEYANLTAPLVEAVKELKKRDETNKQKITELESAIGDLRMEIEQLKNK